MDPQVGFVTRRDIRRTDAFGRYTVRPSALGLRKIDLFLEGQHIVRTDGEKQDAGRARPSTWSGTAATAWPRSTSRARRRLDEAFDLGDRVPVPAGRLPRPPPVASRPRSASSRPLVLAAEVERLDSFGGRLAERRGGGRGRPGLAPDAWSWASSHNRVSLPGGCLHRQRQLAARRLRLHARGSSPPPSSSTTAWTRRLVTNLRLNFIHRPGSDLFVVFNEERGDGAPLRRVAEPRRSR